MRVESAFSKAMVAGALLAWAASAQAASFNISNDQGAWLASVQAMGTTTYGTGNFVGVGCAPGVACPGVAVNGLPGVGVALGGDMGGGSASYGGPSTGLLNNLASPTQSSTTYLEWTFATAQNGWGGTFAMAGATTNPGNAGLRFQANDLVLGWIDVLPDITAGQALNGFYGFTSTDRFAGVRVLALPQVPGGPSGTSYSMTDVSIARADQAAAPEPASLALFGLAGAALTAARRRRRA